MPILVSAESIYLDEETSVKFRIDKGMSTRVLQSSCMISA